MFVKFLTTYKIRKCYKTGREWRPGAICPLHHQTPIVVVTLPVWPETPPCQWGNGPQSPSMSTVCYLELSKMHVFQWKSLSWLLMKNLILHEINLLFGHLLSFLLFFCYSCRLSSGDSVHRTSLCIGGWESHLHLSGHCQPTNYGLQVWLTFVSHKYLHMYTINYP